MFDLKERLTLVKEKIDSYLNGGLKDDFQGVEIVNDMHIVHNFLRYELCDKLIKDGQFKLAQIQHYKGKSERFIINHNPPKNVKEYITLCGCGYILPIDVEQSKGLDVDFLLFENRDGDIDCFQRGEYEK